MGLGTIAMLSDDSYVAVEPADMTSSEKLYWVRGITPPSGLSWLGPYFKEDAITESYKQIGNVKKPSSIKSLSKGPAKFSATQDSQYNTLVDHIALQKDITTR